jgi:hypothetical protein
MKLTMNSQGYPTGLQDPVSLDDSVWTILHIALYLGQKPDSLNGVVNAYGFPQPLTNQKRNRRWLAEDVKAFFVKRSQGQLQEPIARKIDKAQTPKSMRLKG